jgi:RNA polymerase sigma factor (sigma-70 family)
MKTDDKGQPVASFSDNQLMEEVKNGRVEKLAVLFERHHVMLFNFFLRLSGNREASEDLVQDVFFRILKYRATFQGQSKFTVWMYQIARNAHIDHLRKRGQELPLDDQFGEAVSLDISPPDSLDRDQEAALLRKALEKLPMKKREILILSRYQDMKYKDLAELFGCRVGTIKSYVHRAIKDLSDIYRELQGGIVS